MELKTTIREPLATFHEALAYLNTTERTLRRWLSKREVNGLQPIARKLGGEWFRLLCHCEFGAAGRGNRARRLGSGPRACRTGKHFRWMATSLLSSP